MLLQTLCSLQQLKTLVMTKATRSSNLSFLEEMRWDINMIFWIKWSMPSVKFEKTLKAFLLIDTSIILNWLLRGTNLFTKNCICWISFLNCMITVRDILQCGINNTIYHSSFRCCNVLKGVLECQIRNRLSARKWVLIPKI